MGAWTKNKVDSSLINGGQEYEKGDNVPLGQLNAITNNSFYAVDRADEALVKANSAFENNGTVVKVANSAVTGLYFDSDPQTQINEKATQNDLNTTNSQVDTNTRDITSLTNNKANNDLSNVTYPSITAGSTTSGSGDRVVEQYLSSDGQTWYRKWASGWKECGMFYQSPSISLSSVASKDIGLIALPITFSNTNYNVQCTTTWTASAGHQFVFDTSKTNNTNDSIFLAVTRVMSSGSASPACFITCAGY